MYEQQIIDLFSDQGIKGIPAHIITAIANDKQVIREIEQNDFDTITRELIYDKLPEALGVSVSVVDMFGKKDQFHWPHYGDPEAYDKEWMHQMIAILTVAGATLEEPYWVE